MRLLRIETASILTYLFLGLTCSGQTGTGTYEHLFEAAERIALGEILSTDETRMAADGPMYGEVRILKMVKGALSPALRFGASAWVGPTYQEGELRILFLRRILPGQAYYQDAAWASIEAGKLDLFPTAGAVEGCSKDSLLSFLRGLQEVASAPLRLHLGLVQRMGSHLTLSVSLSNDTGKEIWLNPSRLGFRFEANRVQRSLAVRWEDFDDSQWVRLPSGSALSGEASVRNQDIEGMSEITVILDNRSALFPHPSWLGSKAFAVELDGSLEDDSKVP